MPLSRLKQKPNRVLFPLCGTLLPLFLGGCQSAESALDGLRENEILRNAAQGVLMGKAYDRAAIARRNQDSKALREAADALSRIDPLAAAEQLVLAGLQMDMDAESIADKKKKHEAQEEAAQKYREALRISPQFPSQNPDLLNALGYFLADRGTSQKDFQTAEHLLRQALAKWDQLLEPLSGQPLDYMQFNRAQGPHDSLAWALFKQKKLDAAAREQQKVIQTVEKTSSTLNQKISAELYYHYAEIERARGHLDIARTNYQIALQLESGHQPSLDALRSLGPAKTPAPEKPTPQPEEIPRRLSPDAQLT